jgi:hypothetical protein
MSSEKHCQHTLKNGTPCTQQLSGRGVSKYCSGCRDEGRKQDNKQRNQADYDALWDPENEVLLEHHRAENKRSRSKSYYSLTESKLRHLFEHAATPQEEYTHKDDFFEATSKKLVGIPLSISDPLADLPSIAATARH